MCTRQKADPKLLPKLPLFSPSGEILTNGVSSPRHMTESGYDSEQYDLQVSLTKSELERAITVPVEQAIVLSTLDTKHMCLDLVKESEIDLERIDQQLLELGPYAQDAYEDEEMQAESVPVLISPPPDVRRGKKGKQVVPNKSNRKSSRGQEDYPELQRGGWRAMSSGGWNEVERRPEDKDVQKKKWRKVGSAGPMVRGKEGQLDAQSDPLNVSSANTIISHASDGEARGLYHQSPEGGRQRGVDGKGASPTQSVDHELRSSSGHPTKPPGVSVSTTAHTTPSCNTSSPSDLPGHDRTQPTAHWKPVPGVVTPTTQLDHLYPAQETHSHLSLNYTARPQLDTSGTSEDVDIMRVEEEDTPRAALTASVPGAEGQSSDLRDQHPSLKPKGVHRSESPQLQQNKPASSPKTTTTPHSHRHTEVSHPPSFPHHPIYHPPTGVPKPPGFSISHLAKGSDLPAQLSTTDPHAMYMEHARSSLNSVSSPLSEAEGNMRKRRSSSSSSHRSTRQPSLDDNPLTRSASPLSAASHSRAQFTPGIIWDGTNAIPANTKDKLQVAADGKISGIPFSMWPPGMPLPADVSQVQPFPLSSPFLTVSNPWLRGGMIPGLPFRPALYPTGATTNTLDPTNPYKSMLGLPLYPFAPAGLKGPFPNPAFSAPSSVLNSQPQTPSSISTATPGFSFSQFPIPPGLNASALREVQSRFAAAGGVAPSLEQLSSLAAVGSDGKQRGSPDTNQDTALPPTWPTMIPGMPMLQTPFGFGVPNPLSSSVSQASQLNLLAQRGPVPLSTSPLTLATQSLIPGGSTNDGQQQSSVEPFHHQTAGRRAKKQSGSAIDLTGREMRLIEAPSPQEAVKMATQRASPFQDPSRFSPKLKSVSDTVSASPSSSPLVPTFVTNPSSQAQGSILSYPMLSAPGSANSAISGHINPSQLMGVALSGSHMIPMNYPATIPNVNGKGEEGVGKKRRSPKRGGGSQKLRIHQMDFKQQGKVDRRRRRPLKPPEGPQEEASRVKPAASVHTKVAGDQQQSSVAPEDNYALNMLADCSSKEGEKVSQVHPPSISTPQQELAAKRVCMRSPGSIAGANSLLLLAEPSPIAATSSASGGDLRDISSENAVVDGLLRLSNSPVPNSASVQIQQSVQNAASDSGTRSVAAEAILMMGQTGNNGEDVEVKRRKEGLLTDGRGPTAESREKDEADSEKTDTDSEATLSPTTPAPTTTTPPTRDTKRNTSYSPPQISSSTTTPSLAPVADNHVAAIDKAPVSSNDGTSQKPRTLLQEEQGKFAMEMPPPSEVMENVSSESALSSQEYMSGELMPGRQSVMAAREERALLGLDSTSARLEMVGEEEDTDVDIENIDSSLLDKPVESAEPVKPVSSSPVLHVSNPPENRSSMIPPEIFPTSPLPPHECASPPASLQGEVSGRDQGKGDGVDEAGEEIQLDKTTKPYSALSETSEVTPPIDIQSPPRRLEEAREEVKEEEEEEEEMKKDDSTESVLESVDAHTTHPEMVTHDKEASPSPSARDTVAPHSPPLPPVSDDRDPEETMETSTAGEFELVLEPENDCSDTSLPGLDIGPIDSTEREKPPNKISDEDVQETESEIKSNLPLATTAMATVTETEEKTSLETDNNGGTTQPSSASISVPEDQPEEISFPGETIAPPVTGSPDTADHSSSCDWTKPVTPPTPHSPHPLHPPTSHSVRVSPPTEEGNEDSTAVGLRDSNQSHEGGALVSADNSAQTNNVIPVDKTTKKSDSAGDAQSDVSLRVSPSVAQNRLPVGKSGFDRHHQSRKLLSAQHPHKQHPRDDKNSQSKKWSRMADPGARGRGLFDVDPQDASRRQKTDTKPTDRESSKHMSSSSEGRKVKPRILPGVPGGHGLSNKVTSERPKHSSRPPREDPSHRHSRPQEGNQGSAWEQREVSSKQKTRPSGRQGSRLSPSSSSDHSTADHPRDRDELVGIADDDQQQSRADRGRGGHQNSHGWREDRVSPTDHSRERGHAIKHKLHHRTDSKPSFEHGRKISRLEKESQQHVSHRKHVPSMETNNDERGVASFRRHREEDPESVSLTRVKHGASRKRSYESVSEDELLEETNRHSSRESSLVVEDRTRGDYRLSQELTVGEQRGSSWRKEPKRPPDSSDDLDEFSRISSKHKKHKHDSKEHKERRKWRKTTDSSDSKQKRSSEDKPWLSYHKH